MALIKCNECGKEFSDKATNCIHCGCPIEKKEKILCEECGNELNRNDKLCSKCGCPIQTINNKNVKIESKNTKKDKKISIVDIIRYIIGAFFLSFFPDLKSVGIILLILAELLIFPFTANIIYTKINVPKAIKIILPILFIIFALGLDGNNTNLNKTLTCALTAEHDGYNVDGKQVFTFENNSLSNYDHNSYMKFDDTTTGETMFKFLDQNTENFNRYEGVTYKVTFNSKNELRTTIKVNVTSAPEMFVSFLSYDNIDENSSINDIKTALEKDKYTCTIK